MILWGKHIVWLITGVTPNQLAALRTVLSEAWGRLLCPIKWEPVIASPIIPKQMMELGIITPVIIHTVCIPQSVILSNHFSVYHASPQTVASLSAFV